MNIPDCVLGGKCDLVSRDEMFVREFPEWPNTVGISQCLRCSQVYEPVALRPRRCDHCSLEYGESLHDPCLGTLEDVSRACCGHGIPQNAYRVRRSDNLIIRGEA